MTYIGVSQAENFRIDSDKQKLFDFLNEQDFEGLILTNENFSWEIVGFTNKNTFFVDKNEFLSNQDFDKINDYSLIDLSNCNIITDYPNILLILENDDCISNNISYEIGRFKLYYLS